MQKIKIASKLFLFIIKIKLFCYLKDHVALLWIGATDLGQDGYWTWSQSKKAVEVHRFVNKLCFSFIENRNSHTGQDHGEDLQGL